MTVGIYALKFNDLFYIGRSSIIERRKNDHITSIINRTANYKILDAYDKFGLPEFIIIEECNITDLGKLEKYWIKEFNSTKDGLNITSGGDGGGQGADHNRSLHSKEVIKEVFDLLTSDTVLTYTNISKLTGVSTSTINNIADRYQHTWLKDTYPIQYEKLSEEFRLITRKKMAEEERYSKIRGISKKDFKFPDIKDAGGNIFASITNAKQFAENHSLSPQGLCRLFSNKIKSHRGWTLA